MLERASEGRVNGNRPPVFYGSSSIRPWDTLAEDFDPRVLNLGFGGATLEACDYFFSRLVPPVNPHDCERSLHWWSPCRAAPPSEAPPPSRKAATLPVCVPVSEFWSGGGLPRKQRRRGILAADPTCFHTPELHRTLPYTDRNVVAALVRQVPPHLPQQRRVCPWRSIEAVTIWVWISARTALPLCQAQAEKIRASLPRHAPISGGCMADRCGPRIVLTWMALGSALFTAPLGGHHAL